jgi:hypothetical protein
MQSKSTFFIQVLTQILKAPGQKKSIHFACRFRALGSGILQIQKKFQIPEDLRILALFQNFKIPLLTALKGHAKCLNFIYLGAEYGRAGGSCVGMICPARCDCHRMTDNAV